MKKIKVGVKLIAAFLTVAIIAGVIGLIGIINLNSIQQLDTELYERNTLASILAGESSVLFQRTRVNLHRMLITNGDEQQVCINTMKQCEAEADALIQEYSKIEKSAEHQTLFDQMTTLWADYKGKSTDILKLIEQGEVEQAEKYLLIDAKSTADKLQESFNGLFDFNKNRAGERSAMNTATANSAITSVIIILATGVLIAIALGLFMTRSITKPVNATAGQLKKMAAGEDLEEIDPSKFGGEFRQMVNNLNEVRASLYLLLEDSGILVDAAARGDLSTRADAERHKGGYRKIIEGVNNTLDAVIQPMNEAAAVLYEMAKGNLSISVTGEYQGDNAKIKDALNSTISNLKSYIGDISSVLGAMSNGNMTVSISSEYKGDFIALKQSINMIVQSLNQTLLEINGAADQVAAGTGQVSSGSQTISQGATEQASSIEELSTSLTEIAEQTKQNAVNAGKANELASAARDDAAYGNTQMKEMQNAMDQISQSSQNISKIIKVIDDIAFQTNILALNAAVEAARAGVHGKGFAVVAEEVRNLAARSAEAAKETTDLIEGSIVKVSAGTKIADQTAAALSNIVTGVEKAAALVGDIASACNEQATGISQVNQGIEQLSQVVQTNSATAQEAAAASEELSSQADLLKTMVAQFKLNNGQISDSTKKLTADSTAEILSSGQDFGKY